MAEDFFAKEIAFGLRDVRIPRLPDVVILVRDVKEASLLSGERVNQSALDPGFGWDWASACSLEIATTFMDEFLLMPTFMRAGSLERRFSVRSSKNE